MSCGSDEYGLPIFIFPENRKGEQIRISINEYMGHEYIDIRLFFKSDGEHKPTKKGITLKKDQYPFLLQGVLELGETLGFDPLGTEEEG